MKIGIPKVLWFYEDWFAWGVFFEELGLQAVVSADTDRTILNYGLKFSEEEFCLPVKAALGQLGLFKNIVDCIFLPHLVSRIKNSYCCPKFIGLPDAARNSLPDIPPIIDPVIDVNKQSFEAALFKLGLRFTKNPFRIYKAIRTAKNKIIPNFVCPLRGLAKFARRAAARNPEGISSRLAGYPEFFRCIFLCGRKIWDTPQSQPNSRRIWLCGPSLRPSLSLRTALGADFSIEKSGIKLALVAHPYISRDDFMNMRIRRKMAELGVSVRDVNDLPEEILSNHNSDICSLNWEFIRRLHRGLLHFLQNGIDGVIHIACFGCGPDSLAGEFFRRETEARGKPFLQLIIDENTQEAGFDTRIEAFADMIKRKKR